MNTQAQREAGARRVYNLYWESYLCGDQLAFASTLDDAFEMIGTSETEICHGKADGIAFYDAQLRETVGKVEMRNRSIKTVPVNEMFLINEVCDIYILIAGEWEFYSKIRISTLLRETPDGWKVVQQHGSLPDTRPQEGETVSFEHLTKENLRLRDAVKRRTIELEQKIRELEIEAAMERVRAKALAMYKSEDFLTAAIEIFQVLNTLGINPLRSGLSVMDELSQEVEAWSVTKGENHTVIPLHARFDSDVHAISSEIFRHWKLQDPHWEIELTGDALRSFVEGMPRDYVPRDEGSGELPSHVRHIVFHYFSFSKGVVFAGTDHHFDAEEIRIMQKVTQVFAFAYTRYLDLEKAESQAREARIEAALEKVRSRSLAMHKSDELQNVVQSVYERLRDLHVELDTAIIILFTEGSKDTTWWLINEKGMQFPNIHVPYANNLHLRRLTDARENGADFFTVCYSKDEKNLLFDHLFTQTDFRYTPEEQKEYLRQFEYASMSVALTQNVAIQTTRYSDKNFSEQENDILKRLTKVFHQAYTRFLDLQKAEAQAREGQIQLSLERVRARTMAMHKSEELASVASVLFDQLTELGILHVASGFVIFDKHKARGSMWMSFEGGFAPMPFDIDFALSPVLTRVYQSWKSGEAFYLNNIEGEEFIRHIQVLKKIFGDRIDEIIEKTSQKQLSLGKNMPVKMVMQHTFFQNGSLVLNNFTPINEQEILNRFAGVFDQTYTRFLDLQKAEAQVREAQIEASLEKVRAKVMAMNTSQDLNDTSLVFGEQLRKLGIDWQFSYFWLIEEDKDDNTFWITWPDRQTSTTTYSLAEADAGFKECIIAWRNQEKIHGTHVPIEHVQAWLDTFERITQDACGMAVEIMKTDNFKDGVYYYDAMIRFGSFGILMNRATTDEEKHIQARFATEFERAYTRFLDLQKAEAQAREAQIEASLERVRSRTMAMQKSEELKEVIQIVYEQFVHLDIPAEHTGFIMDYKVRDDYYTWIADKFGTPSQVTLPYFDCIYYNRFNEAKEKGIDFFTTTLTLEEKNRFYEDLFKHVPGFPEESKRIILNHPGFTISTVLLENVALYIENFSGVPYSDEENAILVRFGKVFEQTYTRFLDLQKAEAQARESQIQLALERVRARTMAMQKSDEFSEAVFILFNQFRELGENPDQATIGLINEKDWVIEYWVTMYGNQMDKVFKFSIDEPNVTNRIYKAWKAKKKSLVIDLSGKELYAFTHYRESMGGAKYNPDEKRRIFNVAFFSKGLLIVQSSEVRSEQSIHLLERFSAVFEQTYTRFLDLQKAEAQAREAQIEAALEKVRSRSLAMHKSDELKEVIKVLFEKQKELGFNFDGSGIQLFTEGSKDTVLWIAAPDHLSAPALINLPYSEEDFKKSELIRDIWKAKEEEGAVFNKTYSYEEKNKYFDYVGRYNDFTNIPVAVREFQVQAPGYTASIVMEKNSALWVDSWSEKTISVVEFNVLKRFSKVFEQSYIRFLDLQKAEAQAWEGQIQLAMERVRARTMAMQKSDELPEAANLLFQQVQSLGMPAWSAGYCIWDEDKQAITLWMSSEGVLQPPFKLPLTEDPSCMRFLEAHQKGETFYVEEIGGEELASHYRYMRSLPVVGEVLQAINDAGFPLPTFQIFHCAYFSKGFLLFITYEPVPEAHDIFKRFGKVFDQTYTRFLDLQKAEAQTREAQIEAALERVRSRSMAMHQSEELSDCAKVLFRELSALGGNLWTSGFVILNDDDASESAYHTTDSSGEIEPAQYIPNTGDPAIAFLYQGWKVGEEYRKHDLSGNAIKEHYANMLALPKSGHVFQAVLDAGLEFPDWQQMHAAYFRHGYILVISLEPFDDQELLIRFAKVFEQTYTRFLDLKKAEAQAREAQIEASLERVRAKAMAMHTSTDLSDATAIVFSELERLGIMTLRCGILIGEENNHMQVLTATSDEEGKVVRITGRLDMTKHPMHIGSYEAWKTQQKVFTYKFSGEDIQKYYQALEEMPEYSTQYINKFYEDHYINTFIFPEGALFTFTEQAPTDDILKVLSRFASVFSLTYRRYLDLQKAETQAREAQIEASLERIRAKAMAMHDSQDLADTIGAFYLELQSFSITPRRCGVGLLKKEDRYGELFTWNTTEEGLSMELVGTLKMEGHPILEGVYEHWLVQKEFHTILRGKEIPEYYNILRPQLAFPDYNLDEVQYGYFFFFPEGGVYAWTNKEMHEDELKLYRRFTSVLSLTYKRYSDLKEAEAQAREAIKQASLDRIRGQIASMRSTQDLQRITPLIWQELTNLQVPFIRCGVFIMDDAAQIVHTYLSTADGKDIAAIHLPYSGMSVTEQTVAHWKSQTVYTVHWDKAAFYQWTKQLIDQGYISSTEKYQAGSAPNHLHLHFVPFTQGMLYVGSVDPLPDDSIDLIRSLAAAFATAYARYEDFIKLEAEKQKTDLALADLEAAKDQLVQQEKLASLGQLTAGIAHEIKNPLNFVTNFSEVSKELLDEMLEELTKGNSESVKSITDDIKFNLDKIHEHGSRADSIVKSMLMHSRGGSGQKEPTDLNALITEYVNLTFHGMRAGKHPINVKIELNLDDTLGHVPVIVEDMSRVIVNLCNNAFDAMRSKLSDQSLNKEYSPKLIVRTKRGANHAIIEIADNGPGIPENIKDKILQPFFTTKKGTQGTGLGLSISNDIVKAHGGELRVQSAEAEGSVFQIQLSLT